MAARAAGGIKTKVLGLLRKAQEANKMRRNEEIESEMNEDMENEDAIGNASAMEQDMFEEFRSRLCEMVKLAFTELPKGAGCCVWKKDILPQDIYVPYSTDTEAYAAMQELAGLIQKNSDRYVNAARARVPHIAETIDSIVARLNLLMPEAQEVERRKKVAGLALQYRSNIFEVKSKVYHFNAFGEQNLLPPEVRESNRENAERELFRIVEAPLSAGLLEQRTHELNEIVRLYLYDVSPKERIHYPANGYKE